MVTEVSRRGDAGDSGGEAKERQRTDAGGPAADDDPVQQLVDLLVLRGRFLVPRGLLFLAGRRRGRPGRAHGQDGAGGFQALQHSFLHLTGGTKGHIRI